MVQKKMHQPEMRATYLFKPGQTFENTKPSERTRALIMPRSTYQRFVDCVTEEDRMAAQQEQQAAKLAALKKATYEKSKTWDTKIENIKARKMKELLSKKRKDEEEREVFVKEMAKKKATERAEVVQQARKLLLEKKPLCRRINRALLVSECLRELDAQVSLQKTIRAMDKELDAEYANSIKANVAQYEEQKKQEADEQARKIRDYGMELKKRIDENEEDKKQKATEELKAEKQEQRYMARDMQLMREKEMQDILSKKKKLQKFFKEAIEEKKRFELELQREEELEDRVIQVYRKTKDRIENLHKSLKLKEKEERKQREQITMKEYNNRIIERANDREKQEQKMIEKAVEEKEATEAEKRKAREEREKTMRALMDEFKLQDAAVREERKQKEKILKDWEMMQRFKRDEYNKQTDLDERKQQWQQKLKYRDELRKIAEEKQLEKKHEENVLEAEATNLKAAIERTNQRILQYGDEVLQESKCVRPLYPIVRAIEECKKEMGLIPPKKIEEKVTPKKKYRNRRVCRKSVPAEKIYYFQ
ncbi:golgin subfamily A member 6-like protein 6 [Pseudomyrmex gracilis]|uniref:golgin subfamily A member 6-like protein 6 n=1 Tax=Pseudomyrmex gracilis TaxID=219809 RepID=UPI000995D158|nr:golgin subfamily A member 6-like protein 6 [Pseudomyrmex gracilis]